MRLGMIGLGKMGGNMARRLRNANIEVVGYNRDETVTESSPGNAALRQPNLQRRW